MILSSIRDSPDTRTCCGLTRAYRFEWDDGRIVACLSPEDYEFHMEWYSDHDPRAAGRAIAQLERLGLHMVDPWDAEFVVGKDWTMSWLCPEWDFIETEEREDGTVATSDV